MKRFNSVSMILVVLFLLSCIANAEVAPINIVKSYQKINELEGGFTGDLSYWGLFGNAVSIGDLDGDGVSDLAVTAHHDNDGGPKTGAIWILFMNTDGTVKDHQKISRTSGNFSGPLNRGDYFGTAIACLGDIDNDGVTDLAVTAHEDYSTGSVWILFLHNDGTVRNYQRINTTEGNFTGDIDTYDRFGRSITSLGDFDGDGVTDIAVGASLADDGGMDRGEIWILFLNADGTVKNHKKISNTEGGFTGTLENDDRFSVVSSMGDLDGDGITDIAVGAVNDDDGGYNRGAIWILFLNADATVKCHQKISNTEGGFTGILRDEDHIGNSLASIGDIDGDGITDLAVGSLWSEVGFHRGTVWLLLMNADGTVKDYIKISETEGGFNGLLYNGDYFGYTGVVPIGDLDGDGIVDLAVAAQGDDSTQKNAGALWILFLNDIKPKDPIEEILDFIDDSVEKETLVPVKPGKPGQGQLGALINMIEAAGDLIEAELFLDACQQLWDALEKTDGLSPPESAPDFVIGEATPELAGMIEILMESFRM